METDADATTGVFCTARQQLVSICFNIITDNNKLRLTLHVSIVKWQITGTKWNIFENCSNS